MTKPRYIVIGPREGALLQQRMPEMSFGIQIPHYRYQVESDYLEPYTNGTQEALSQGLNWMAERGYRLKFLIGNIMIFELHHCPMCALAQEE